METLLIIAGVIIVALIVIAMDQASQLELERALHKHDRSLTSVSETLYKLTQEIDAADRALLQQRVAELQGALNERFIENAEEWDEWDVGEDGQVSYEADEFGFCLTCGVNHEQEDAAGIRFECIDCGMGFPDPRTINDHINAMHNEGYGDYKRAEDVVIDAG